MQFADFKCYLFPKTLFKKSGVDSGKSMFTWKMVVKMGWWRYFVDVKHIK